MMLFDSPDDLMEWNFDRETGVLNADFTPPASFAPFRGHFPGNPILPGIAQISLVTEILARAFGDGVKLDSVRRVKYLSPAYPDMPLHFELTVKKEDGPFHLVGVTISGADARVSVMKLRYTGVPA